MVDHRNELVFGHLNTNSAHNKFELLSEQVKIDVLIISETKVDDSFPIANFLIDGFSTTKVEVFSYLWGKIFHPIYFQ